MRDVASWAVAVAQVGLDLRVDRWGFFGLARCRPSGQLRDSPLELVGADIPLIQQELSDTAEPLLVVPKFEVIERVHQLGAGAQVRPRPLIAERCRHRVDRVFGQCGTEVIAQRHHRHMNAEDALLPILDEHPLFQTGQWRQTFESTDKVLESHFAAIPSHPIDCPRPAPRSSPCPRTRGRSGGPLDGKSAFTTGSHIAARQRWDRSGIDITSFRLTEPLSGRTKTDLMLYPAPCL